MGLSAAILVCCLFVAVDVCVLMELVHRRHEPERPDYGLLTILAGAVAGAVALGAVAVLLLAVYSLNLFGRAHVLYSAMTVAVPVVGGWLVVRNWAGRLRAGVRTPGWAAALGLVLVLPGPVGAWSSFVVPYDLHVDRVELVVSDGRGPGEGAEGGGAGESLRIAVVTDIQSDDIADYERDAIERIMDEEADLILLGGDYVQGPRDLWESQVAPLRTLLSGLSAPGGVFVVPGNVDDPALLRRAVEGSGATYLENEIVSTTVRGRDVTIGGIEFFYARDEPERTIRALEAIPAGDDDLRILLAHHPDAVTALSPGSPVDLVAAGHSHGGQVVLPVIGPFFTATERVPEAVALGGLSEVAGNQVYVSTGVGMERRQAPQVRFGVPPSFGLLTVR